VVRGGWAAAVALETQRDSSVQAESIARGDADSLKEQLATSQEQLTSKKARGLSGRAVDVECAPGTCSKAHSKAH
jgi:hypothetical protein